MDLGHNRQIDLCDKFSFILTILGPLARGQDMISLA